MPFVVHLRLAKEHHLMFKQSGVDVIDLGITGVAYVDAENLGAECTP
jgi:hypothetical protein